MALQSLIFDKAGKTGVWLNSLKRFALSAIVVPTQQNTVVKIPLAASSTQPGRSVPIPLQGPADATTELYSLTGKEGVRNQGIGVITTTGGNTNVTGIGTKFLSQLQIGDTIATDNEAGKTIATVASDTLATTTVAMAANTTENFFFVTPTNAAVTPYIFVDIVDQGWRRRLMNKEAPVAHVFGSNTKPLFMKESSLLKTDQTWLMTFLNYSTTARASFAPIAEGRKWQYEAMKYPEVYKFLQGLEDRKMYIQPYWLTLDNQFVALAAPTGSQGNATLTCTGDITLVLFNCYANAVNSAGADVSTNVRCSLQDPKTKRSMQVQSVPLTCMGGTAENPMRLSAPWIVEPQTQIAANFVNNSGAAATVFMTFHGVAIYTGSSWRGSTLNNAHLINEAAKMYEAMSTPQIRPASPQ